MESLSSKKVRLLGRWLKTYLPISTDSNRATLATSIISLLDEIEQAYYNDSFEMSGVRED